MDGDGKPVGTEDFDLSPGLVGFHYTSSIRTDVPEPHKETVDVFIAPDFRPLQVRIDTWSNAITVRLDRDPITATRNARPLPLPEATWTEIDYLSPVFNALTMVRMREDVAEFDVLYLEPVTCDAVYARQRYERLWDELVTTPVGEFEATRWRFTALDTGFTRQLWSAGPLVLAYEGLYELESYHPGTMGPPPRD